MLVKTFPIVLEETQLLSPNVKHFRFRSSQTPAFNYLPGQFITMHFEHHAKTLRRSYSIANVPTQNNCIEFAAGYVENGIASELLFGLKPGDILHINGPFGRLVLKDTTPKRYIFVATSTGITPYRAMLRELEHRLQAHPQLNIVILQGVQNREDILYGDELLAFAQKHPRVSFRAYLSREKKQPLHPHEHLGYVQHAFPDLALHPEEDMIYLCGNPSMIDDAYTYLKNQQFNIQQIIREKYISS